MAGKTMRIAYMLVSLSVNDRTHAYILTSRYSRLVRTCLIVTSSCILATLVPSHRVDLHAILVVTKSFANLPITRRPGLRAITERVNITKSCFYLMCKYWSGSKASRISSLSLRVDSAILPLKINISVHIFQIWLSLLPFVAIPLL